MAKDFRRLAVVKGLEKVSQSGFSNLVLPSLLEEGNLQEKDKNFVTAVFYGTLEHKITLDYILQKYIDDVDVSDIRVTSFDRVFIKRKGNWERIKESFNSKEDYTNFVRYCILKNN